MLPLDDAPVSQTEMLISKFQAMSEAEFTRRVLIPLFKLLNYEVDYYGGVNEGGKDLICWKSDAFGERELTVVQVKKTNATAAAAKSTSFAGLVTQLYQASEKVVPSLSGREQRPNHLYFVTPYPIDVRALQTRFEKLADLATRGVKILDGTIIAERVIRLFPALADEICGADFVITDRLLSTVTNADLLSALNYSSGKDTGAFYCDLDFGVGRVTTKFFFEMEFDPVELDVKVNAQKWATFEPLLVNIQRFFEIDIVVPSLSQAKSEYQEKHEKWRSASNQAVIAKIFDLSNEIEVNLAVLSAGCSKIGRAHV